MLLVGKPLVQAFFWLFLVIACISTLRGQGLLAFASLLVVATLVVAALWNHRVYAKLTVSRRLDKKKVEFGEACSYIVEVSNKKFLPVWGLVVKDRIPESLVFANEQVTKKGYVDAALEFRDLFSLRMFERARRVYGVLPTKRGVHVIGEGSLHYGDPFDLFEQHRYDALGEARLVVYPQILSMESLAITHSDLFGVRGSRGWIHTDPLNKVGTRLYTSDSSSREINWKASARHRNLQVDVCQPSFEKEVHLFLDFPPSLNWWEQKTQELLEWSICLCASLIQAYHGFGYKVNLYSNVVTKKSAESTFTVVKPKALRDARDVLLTSLAGLHHISIASSTRLLQREKSQMRAGSSLVFITPHVEEEVYRELLSVRNRFPILLLQTKEGPLQGPLLRCLLVTDKRGGQDENVLGVG